MSLTYLPYDYKDHPNVNNIYYVKYDHFIGMFCFPKVNNWLQSIIIVIPRNPEDSLENKKN